MEREMEEVFERKVREKRQKLADSQADLEKRHKESKDKLEAQKRELEAKMSAFEQEKVLVSNFFQKNLSNIYEHFVIDRFDYNLIPKMANCVILGSLAANE